MSFPLVSIIVPTFNHAKFIAQTLDGILMQKTNFSYEILIGDDASKDTNAEIIHTYQQTYPQIIKAFLHTENLGPKEPRELGGKNNVAFLFKQAKAPYIALCEGDDYWTDEYKLQKQIDFLEQNPAYALCHHQMEIIYEDGSPSTLFNTNNQVDTSSLEYLLGDESWILGTASTVFRNTIQGNFPDWWMQTASGDLGIFILVSQFGKIKYLPQKMGVYRKHHGGMTNIHTPQNIIFLENRMKMFENLKPYFAGKYDIILDKTIEKYSIELANLKNL